MQILTFHDPILSLLQSALHQTLVARGEPATANGSAGHPAMQALVAAGLAATEPGKLPSPADRDALLQCAELTVKHALATGGERQLLENEIKGALCDPLWGEMLTAYAKLKVSGQSIPYVPYDAAAQPNPPVELEAGTVSIALLADWGMGTPVAQNVLAQAVTALPSGRPVVQPASMLIHMGDIYYAGTPSECEAHFVDVARAAVPGAFTSAFPVRAIPGNHEYYSGGFGFFGTVLPLCDQTNSFFCLRTPQWQVVALDTGRNDCDPITVGKNVTFLTADQKDWLDGVMASAGTRRTILLSHHQLYSGAFSVGTQDGVVYGMNPLLHAQLEEHYPQIAVWLWGHEHNTVIFQAQNDGVPLGRCIGSASLPILVKEQPYAPDPRLNPVPGVRLPQMDASVQLSNNGTVYAHGFAVLSLSPEEATVSYYQVPLPAAEQAVSPAATLLFSESFAAAVPMVPVSRIPEAVPEPA